MLVDDIDARIGFKADTLLPASETLILDHKNEKGWSFPRAPLIAYRDINESDEVAIPDRIFSEPHAPNQPY